MVYLHARCVALVLVLFAALYLPALASGKRRTETRMLKPPISFLPSGGAPEALDAPILSGLDFTAVAPPGERLRVVEDEPYILLQGYSKKGLKQDSQGISKLVLHSNSPDGGTYEARVSLRYNPQKNDRNALLLSFDTAAHYAYKSGLLSDESRGSTAYNLREIRSPLGLTDPRDKENLWREYLAYDAAVLNPNSSVASGITTPYQYISGELKVVRRVEARYYLLTINFEANEYAHAPMLTENIARCIINRLAPGQDQVYLLDYAAYYPEYELAKPYYEGEVIHPGTADLTERPGEGCGIGATPITGDVCPECGDGGPFWAASPFGDGEYGSQLGTLAELPQCSHCMLHAPEFIEEKCVEEVPCGGCKPPGCKHNTCQPRNCEPHVCEPLGRIAEPITYIKTVCDTCGHHHEPTENHHDEVAIEQPFVASTNRDVPNFVIQPTTVAESKAKSNEAEKNEVEENAKSTAKNVREKTETVKDKE